MRIYKTRWFSRWAKKEKLSDKALLKAVDEIKSDLSCVNLGGHVYKKRVALSGRGKSGGARTLVAYNQDDVIFFIYGFAKNERENIQANELKALQLLAEHLLDYTDLHIKLLILKEELVEITNER